MRNKISDCTTIKLERIEAELYPTLLFDKKKISKTEFPNFNWNGNNLKKVTKFRYFIAGISLWFLLLKNKILNK